MYHFRVHIGSVNAISYLLLMVIWNRNGRRPAHARCCSTQRYTVVIRRVLSQRAPNAFLVDRMSRNGLAGERTRAGLFFWRLSNGRNFIYLFFFFFPEKNHLALPSNVLSVLQLHPAIASLPSARTPVEYNTPEGSRRRPARRMHGSSARTGRGIRMFRARGSRTKMFRPCGSAVVVVIPTAIPPPCHTEENASATTVRC